MKKYALHTNSGLLTAIAKNDEIAFAEIYDRFWHKLYAVAYNRFADAEVAADVVHDVFLSLWQARSQIKIDQLENYLATAAKYAVLNKIKKKVRENNYLQSKVSFSKEENDAESVLHYRQILEKVNIEIERLPQHCKLIFKCRRELGMPVKEIASTLNISTKTVENQITKASKRIKLLMTSSQYLSIIALVFIV